MNNKFYKKLLGDYKEVKYFPSIRKSLKKRAHKRIREEGKRIVREVI